MTEITQYRIVSTAMASSDEEIYGTLSNFEIEKKIGRGQFSVVYRAKCVANDQIVALKKVQVNELNFFTCNYSNYVQNMFCQELIIHY